MSNPVKPVRPGDIHRLHRETRADQHDANTIIVCLLLRLGGGVTISQREFIEGEILANRLEVIAEDRPGGDAVVHFRVKP